MAQGGEFAFVLYSAAAGAGILEADTHSVLTAAVILSMVLTPLLIAVHHRLMPPEAQSMDGIDAAEGLRGTVLIIGFGRVGQVMSQLLLARGVDVSIIDTDVEMIRSAEEFGFKVYFGDGTRLDVLRTSGAAEARAIAVCVGSPAATDRIVEMAKSEFPGASLVVRSFDREHALKLIKDGVDLQVRETFESALVLGALALKELGVPKEEAAEIVGRYPPPGRGAVPARDRGRRPRGWGGVAHQQQDEADTARSSEAHGYGQDDAGPCQRRRSRRVGARHFVRRLMMLVIYRIASSQRRVAVAIPHLLA